MGTSLFKKMNFQFFMVYAARLRGLAPSSKYMSHVFLHVCRNRIFLAFQDRFGTDLVGSRSLWARSRPAETMLPPR